MPFSQFGLHPDLLRGVREMGFTRPTPIQADAIPPALEGRDVLACAMTGSGKTAAFLLPILHRLIGQEARRHAGPGPDADARARGADRRARQGARRPHAALRSASVFGGVGMGPQEHAFRTGVDVIVATPGRLLDHFRFPYAKLEHLEVLVLDEADRMLDMGFLPDIRRVLKHLPARRQTLFFSATMPPPIAQLSREMLKNPFTVNLERKAAPAVGITQAVYPVPQNLKAPLLLELLKRGDIKNVLVFTRTKHRANRLAESLDEARRRRASASTATAARRSARRRWPGSRRAATGSSSRPTSPPAASTSRPSRTSSTSTCRTSPRTTSTASAAPPAPR